jgi:transposase
MNTLFTRQHASDIEATILSMLRCYNSIPYGLQRRLKAILKINKSFNMSGVAKRLDVSCGFVIKWRDRAVQFFATWPTEPTDDKERRQLLIKAFADAPRSGAPGWYAAEQLCNVIALALKQPTECGREITHWTYLELADEANEQGLTILKISKSTVGRLLVGAAIKPHHSIYWLNPNIKDEETFREEVVEVCDTYHQAPVLAKKNVFTVSTDEKTGIQALGRIAPTKSMLPGSVEKREFEYKRHGTFCLTPSFNVVTGMIMHYTIDETRDEIDFYEHIINTVEISADSTWIFVSDQLNTHKSDSLVRYVAEQCGIKEHLGIKGKSGILKSMESRQAFLIDKCNVSVLSLRQSIAHG